MTPGPEKDIYKIFQQLSKDLAKATKVIMVNANGAGRKYALSNSSDLVKSVEVYFDVNTSEFVLLANPYFDAVSDGRRPMNVVGQRPKKNISAGTVPKKNVPYQAILDWIQAKGIRPRQRGLTQQNLAWIFQKSIAKYGISGKQYRQAVYAAMDETVEEVIDKDLLNLLTQQLEKYFVS